MILDCRFAILVKERGGTMAKKIGVFTIAIVTMASPYLPQAEQATGKVSRVGYLDFRSSDLKMFRQGLRDLGYIEVRNIAIEYRSAKGEQDRLAELAAERVRCKVDVIATRSGQGS